METLEKRKLAVTRNTKKMQRKTREPSLPRKKIQRRSKKRNLPEAPNE